MEGGGLWRFPLSRGSRMNGDCWREGSWRPKNPPELGRGWFWEPFQPGEFPRVGGWNWVCLRSMRTSRAHE
jgi:hypothetical protein